MIKLRAKFLAGLLALAASFGAWSAGTIGYSITPSADITLVGGAVEQRRLMRTPSADYVATTGDNVTVYHVYVASGGSGADSTLNIGIYSGSSTTNPSASVLICSDTLVVTLAMKTAPGWYTKSTSCALTGGVTYRIAYAGVTAGTLALGADGGAGNASETDGENSLSNPWGETTFNTTTMVGLYATVAGASPPLATMFLVF